MSRLAAVEVFQTAGHTPVPAVFASALPSGVVAREAFEELSGIILYTIQDTPEKAGIYLYLHGAMQVEGVGSGDAALVHAIRTLVGPRIPIAVAADFHAVLPDGFFRDVNVFHAFRTAPHTDHADTERRAARGLLRCMGEGIRPRIAAVRVPILAADAAVTAREPLASLMKDIEACDSDPDIVSAAFCNGQPWIDSSYTGACVALSFVRDGRGALAKAKALAARLWQQRNTFSFDAEVMDPERAVGEARKSPLAPVFVMDSGDNTTAGAEGEGTLLMRLVMEQMAAAAGSSAIPGKRILICGLTDVRAMKDLAGLAVGSRWQGRVGNGGPGDLDAQVPFSGELVHRGKVIGWAGEIAGASAVVSSGCVDVALTDVRAAFLSVRHIEAAGLDLKKYGVIVLKMGYLFPELRPHAARSIMALTPGSSTNDFSTINYRNLHRPMFPLDREFSYSPKGTDED
jgi:microcystin degradation protein MlrC